MCRDHLRSSVEARPSVDDRKSQYNPPPPYKAGIGTTAIGGKFDFYGDERRGISVSVYPQLEFAPAHGAEKGLSEAGQTLVLPLLVAREFHAFTFVFNDELEKPLHDPSRQLASGFDFAFGRSFTRKVAAMIELRTESSIDLQRDRLVLVNAGIIDGVRNASCTRHRPFGVLRRRRGISTPAAASRS